MISVLAWLARLAAIVLGYSLACLAASAFLNLLFFAAQDLAAGEERAVALATSLVSVPVLALAISHLAFLPASAAIVAGELLAWRDWLSWALAGGTAAVAAAFLPQDFGGGLAPDPGRLAAVAAAGMLAGIVYWIVAGRIAGCWSRRPTSPRP